MGASGITGTAYSSPRLGSYAFGNRKLSSVSLCPALCAILKLNQLNQSESALVSGIVC